MNGTDQVAAFAESAARQPATRCDGAMASARKFDGMTSIWSRQPPLTGYETFESDLKPEVRLRVEGELMAL